MSKENIVVLGFSKRSEHYLIITTVALFITSTQIQGRPTSVPLAVLPGLYSARFLVSEGCGRAERPPDARCLQVCRSRGGGDGRTQEMWSQLGWG